MKQTFTKSLLLASIAFFTLDLANAQTSFYSEDFSSNMGLPAGWTTDDADGAGYLWEWCDDASAANPCIPNWTTYNK